MNLLIVDEAASLTKTPSCAECQHGKLFGPVRRNAMTRVSVHRAVYQTYVPRRTHHASFGVALRNARSAPV